MRFRVAGVEMDGSMEGETAEFTLRQEKLKVGSSDEEGFARRWCAQGSQPSSLCPTFWRYAKAYGLIDGRMDEERGRRD